MRMARFGPLWASCHLDRGAAELPFGGPLHGCGVMCSQAWNHRTSGGVQNWPNDPSRIYRKMGPRRAGVHT